MTAAWQIMLVATGITFATGFLIALLIQILCWVVSLKRSAPSDEALKIALAVALAVRQQREK